MQSDLVGAHAMGMRNVLLTTGSPAPRGELCRRDVGLRRRRDRPHEHGGAAQSRARHRRAADRRADAVSHRRRGQSVCAGSRRRVAPARSQSRSRRGVPRHAADLRPRRRSSACCRGCKDDGAAGARRRRGARGPAARGVPRERSGRRARAGRAARSAAARRRRARRGAWRSRVEIARGLARPRRRAAGHVVSRLAGERRNALLEAMRPSCSERQAGAGAAHG